MSTWCCIASYSLAPLAIHAVRTKFSARNQNPVGPAPLSTIVGDTEDSPLSHQQLQLQLPCVNNETRMDGVTVLTNDLFDQSYVCKCVSAGLV